MTPTLQPRLPDGGGRGGVRGAARDPHLLLPPPLQDGGQLQEPALLPRGHQLDLPELGDGPLPPPDLPEGSDGPDGVLADPGARYITRCDIAPLSKVPAPSTEGRLHRAVHGVVSAARRAHSR